MFVEWLESLLTRLEKGFNAGITVLLNSALECKNSARSQPKIVNSLLEYELEKWYLDGHYDVSWRNTIYHLSNKPHKNLSSEIIKET